MAIHVEPFRITTLNAFKGIRPLLCQLYPMGRAPWENVAQKPNWVQRVFRDSEVYELARILIRQETGTARCRLGRKEGDHLAACL